MAFAITAIGGLAGAALVGGTAATLGGAAIGATIASSRSASKSADKATAQAGAIADQQVELGKRELDLAETQYADQKALTEQLLPFYRQQLELNVAEQAKSTARGDQQWESYLSTFQPIEQKMAETALNYDTPARRAAEAARASGAVGTEFDNARAATRTALADSGVMPGDGKMLALEGASRINEAVARAGASDNAMRTVEQTGLGLVDNAARFGRNMPSTGLSLASTAMNQGGAASGAAAGQIGATAAPVQYSAPLFQASGSTIGQAGNTVNNAYQIALSGQKQQQGLFGDLLGAGLKAYGMGVFGSSEEIKDIHGDADLSLEEAAELFNGSRAKVYNYAGDPPGQKYIGPTAEDMQRVTGVGDGQTIDPRNMLGLHHAALGKLVQEVLELKGGSRTSPTDSSVHHQQPAQERQAPRPTPPQFSLSEL